MLARLWPDTSGHSPRMIAIAGAVGTAGSGVMWPALTAQDGDGPLSGESWVVTGKLDSMSRDEVEQRLRAWGQNGQQRIGEDQHRAGGPGCGSKRKKAESLGVPIIDEAQWLRMMEELE